MGGTRLHPGISPDACRDCRRRTAEAERDADEDERLALDAVLLPNAAPAPTDVVARARTAVAAAPTAVRAEAEAVLVELGTGGGGRGAWEADDARDWCRVVATIPWGPAVPELVDRAWASAVLTATRGGYPELDAIRADRVGALAHVARPALRARLRPLLRVGEPGTGTTTLVEVVAEAVARPVAVIPRVTATEHDVYRVGAARSDRSAEPGAIVRAMRRAGTRALVLVLDEVDQVGGTGRRSPVVLAAVLLELLDGPGQSTGYLGVPLALSPAVIVLTVNEREPIPAPLLDRCEVVTVPTLTPAERLALARAHVWPRLLAAYGLRAEAAPVGLAGGWCGSRRPWWRSGWGSGRTAGGRWAFDQRRRPRSRWAPRWRPTRSPRCIWRSARPGVRRRCGGRSGRPWTCPWARERDRVAR